MTSSRHLQKNEMSADRWTDTGCAFHLRSVDAALSDGENHSEHKVITGRTITAVVKWCTTDQRHAKAVSFRGMIKGFFCFRADNKIVYIEKQLRTSKHIILSFPPLWKKGMLQIDTSSSHCTSLFSTWQHSTLSSLLSIAGDNLSVFTNCIS